MSALLRSERPLSACLPRDVVRRGARHRSALQASDFPAIEGANERFNSELPLMKVSTSTSKTADLVQVAALPVRVDDNGSAQVLLLTSRETKRWIIPKGWTMKGREPWEAAAQEALEEAGVVGRPRKKPIGNYVYFKRQQAHFDVCRVDVYVLVFAKQLKRWREKGQREAKWFGLDEAAELVEEPGLVSLLQKLDGRDLSKMMLKTVGSASR
jgi:8-oxo-dGTP pyrophosphatase MutT (NUDIX family)